MKIKLINTQRVLSPTNITLADYVINPYRGCEFGCLYCYSQANKNIQKENFSGFLGIKINAPAVLEKELKLNNPKRVLLGSVTECFQYQELKYNLTKQILIILNNHNIPYTILTKSHLIKNYLNLIAQNKENTIYFTLNLAGDKMIKMFEPNSPPLKQRLTAINEIIKAKVNLRIHLGPFIPFVSNLEEIFKIIPEKAQKIDIELYHNKQGNFKEILNITEKYLGKSLKQKLENIYKTKENYLSFGEKIRNQAKALKKRYNFKVFYIVPDFNQYYNSLINYKNELT
ncbi:MAG: spore photoproduct lyase family protein [Candidatus Omnitrophota bacterium]